jgi:hypothetical protein
MEDISIDSFAVLKVSKFVITHPLSLFGVAFFNKSDKGLVSRFVLVPLETLLLLKSIGNIL